MMRKLKLVIIKIDIFILGLMVVAIRALKSLLWNESDND